MSRAGDTVTGIATIGVDVPLVDAVLDVDDGGDHDGTDESWCCCCCCWDCAEGRQK